MFGDGPEPLEAVIPEGLEPVEELGRTGRPGAIEAARPVAALAHEVGGADLDPARIAEAARSLIAAPSLPRTRRKGATEKTYDLRLLLDGLDVASTRPVVLRARTRFHPEHGTGRPEEVVAALGESAGVAIEIAALSRIRLLLADDR